MALTATDLFNDATTREISGVGPDQVNLIVSDLIGVQQMLSAALPQINNLTDLHTQIIINHTGLPADRSADGLAAWRAAMTRVAECPNVAVKISGIGVRGQAWTADSNREVVMTTKGVNMVRRRAPA